MQRWCRGLLAQSTRGHVTCGWRLCCNERVMSRMNKSRHVWMSHVTYEWVMSYMNESCHIWQTAALRHVYESCHVWIIHVVCYSFSVSLRLACIEYHMTHINESLYTWLRDVLSKIQTQKINVTFREELRKYDILWHFQISQRHTFCIFWHMYVLFTRYI